MFSIWVKCPHTFEGEPTKCEKCKYVTCTNMGLKCHDRPQCEVFRRLAHEQYGYPIVDEGEEG